MTDNDTNFISRWSRRKITPEDNKQEERQGAVIPDSVENDDGKARDSELPLWQQDNVDADIKQQALSALFKQPEFNDVDNLNEYDEDFTSFSGLGDIVTQEMKRMLRLAEEKTRPEPEIEAEKQQDIADSQAEESDDNEQDNEEDRLA